MRLGNVACGMVAMTLSLSAVAESGVDAYRFCVASKLSKEDHIIAAQWLFSTWGASPAVSKFVVISPAEREAIDRKYAALLARAISGECGKLAFTAFAGDAPQALKEASEVIGVGAVNEIADAAEVRKAQKNYARMLSGKK